MCRRLYVSSVCSLVSRKLIFCNPNTNDRGYRLFKRSNTIICHDSRMLSIDTKNKISGDNIVQQSNINNKQDVKSEAERVIPFGKEDFNSLIKELNSLQSNSHILTTSRSRDKKQLLPLFEKQLQLSGFDVRDLDSLNVVHVSGTKGKGSTCIFVESILRSAGLRTGCYTSPHLISVTERININGKPIDELTFTKYFRQVFDRLKYETQNADIPMPGYFAFLTIMAFHVFLHEKVDCVVLEVGIGGEYDPTNVVKNPVVCGITTIDYDHTSLLGQTTESIAWSKAGIAKKGVPLFTIEHEQHEALNMIQSRCLEKGSPLFICKSFENSPDLQLGIQGHAQFTNAALACHLARYFLQKAKGKISPNLDSTFGSSILNSKLDDMPDFFATAIKNCSWPGRCQIINLENKIMYLDGAHTKRSMENCLEWFLESSQDGTSKVNRILLVNIIGDRSRHNILFPLAEYRDFKYVIFSSNKVDSTHEEPDSQTFTANIEDKVMRNVINNSESWKSLTRELGFDDENVILKANISDCLDFIDELTRLYPENKYHILATGSLHFVGAVLAALSKTSNKVN